MASSKSTGPDYSDPTILLNIIKPKKGDPPPFGAIPFDELIFDVLGSSASPSKKPTLIVFLEFAKVVGSKYFNI